MLRKLKMLMVLEVLLLGFVILSCMKDSASPDNIPSDLGMTIEISGLNDSVNAYCYFPITAKIKFRVFDNVEYVDSIIMSTDSKLGASVYKINLNTCTQEFSYAEVGTHKVTFRIYEYRNNGNYREEVYNIRVGMNFGVEAINAEVAKVGTVVPLKATGLKYDNVNWYWDLSSVGLGIIESSGDTSVVINSEVDGNIYVSQIRNGVRTPSVSVPLKSIMHRNSVVPFTVSKMGTEFNALSFFPVTIIANPLQVDRQFIDSINVFMADNVVGTPIMRLAESNNYMGEVNFADTGNFNVVMRVFDGTGAPEVPAYRDTTIALRIGIDFGAKPMNYMVSDTGGTVNLEATGNKAKGVLWVWDLSKIGIVELLERDTSVASVLAKRANYRETVGLYQLKRDTVNGVVSERKSPSKTFDFKTDTASYRVRVVFPNDETHDFTWYRNNLPTIQNFREEAIKSGTSVTLYYYNKDEYVMSYVEYSLNCYSGNFATERLYAVDSAFVGENKISATTLNNGSPINLGQIRGDVDVRFYSRELLQMRLLFPRSDSFLSLSGSDGVGILAADYAGIAIYTLNKDVRSGRIIYKGNLKSQYNAEFVDTFQLTGKLLRKGGHEVYYDTRQYGEKFISASQNYGYKMIRFEFVDSLGVLFTFNHGNIDEPFSYYNGFPIGWASRNGGGGPGYTWTESDDSYMQRWKFYMGTQWDNIFYSMHRYNADTGEYCYNLLDLFPDWTYYNNMPGYSDWDDFWAGRLAYWTY